MSIRHILILLVLFPLTGNAQDEQVVDSLWNVIENTSSVESRLDAKIELAFYLEDNDPQQALTLCEEVIAEAGSMNDNEFLGEGYKTRGEVYRIMGDHAAAIQDFEMAIEIAEEHDLMGLMATTLNSMGVVYKHQGDLAEGILLTKEALQINLETGDEASAAACYNNIGELYRLESKFDSAMVFYQLSLDLNTKVGDLKGQADCYNNMGIVHDYQGQFDEAIDVYLQAIRIYEELKDTEGKAGTLVNIAIIYVYQQKYGKANENFNYAKELYTEINGTYGLAFAIRGLAWVASEKGEYEYAIELFQEVLALRISISDSLGLTDAYTSLAWLYAETDQLDLAIENLRAARSIQESTGNLYTLIYTLTTEADILLRKGDPEGAIVLLHEALEWAIETNSLIEQRFAYKSLAEGYAQTGDYERAYQYHQEYFNINDSIIGVESTNKVNELEELYQAEKRELEIENLEKDNALIEAENAKRAQFIWALSGGLVLVLFAVVVLIRSVQRKRKDNRIITEQKYEVEMQRDLVEEKNQEILDSINYAKRIQEAILPPRKIVESYLDESFILYKPKDIVAGDFYWMEHVDNKVLFAAADCTGHGVPGAMVSVVCSNALNYCVHEEGLSDPGKMLTKARELVVERFERSEEDVKDGMDVALCSLETNKNGAVVEFAGANNPLWIIRNGSEDVEEIKANKEPIGKVDDPTPFTTHRVELGKGDTFYIFSDGYADQFGGERGKKFKTRPFKHLLVSIQGKEMDAQRQLIDSAFETWKGDLEQVDDVCVIGVRI